MGKTAEPTKLKTDEFMWRKHWIQLVSQAGPPFVFLLAWIAIGVILFRLPLDLGGLTGSEITLPWLVLLLIFLGWTWWEYEDYRNDIYILTNDKIIDVEATPLWISMKRKEGGLDRIQNVVAVQKGIWQNLLNYGNVEIKTAAQDEGYTFWRVGNPKLVQDAVFQKLDGYRNRQKAQAMRERQREIVEGLGVFRELKEEEREF